MIDRFYYEVFPKYIDFTNKENIVKGLVYQQLDRSLAMFKLDGLPDTIPYRDYELIKQTRGFVVITDVPGKGLYAFRDELGGEYNPYYMPTKVIIANPALDFYAERTIDKDCVVIPNDSLYLGMMPMYNRYASLIADAYITLRMSSINKRVSFTFAAADEPRRKAAELWHKRLSDGKYSVVDSDDTFNIVDVKPIETGESMTSLIEYINYLTSKWDNEIGINANYNMKRTALHSSEVQLNDYALMPLVDDMYNCAVRGWDKVNAMFGTNVKVDLASVWNITQEEMSARVEEINSDDSERESDEVTNKESDDNVQQTEV